MKSKAEIVDMLVGMSLAMRERGDGRRARAYETAAAAIGKLPDVAPYLSPGRLRALPGIGASIEEKILAFAKRGAEPEALVAAREIAAQEGPVDAIPASYFDAPFQDAPDLHCHTTWSDGTQSLDEVVAFAKRLGAKAIGISDHSGSLTIAGGLDAIKVKAQWADIARVQAAHPDIRILKGTEADILRDGSIDHAPHILDGFDYVIASVHTQLKLTSQQQTERILTALDDPHVTILGHPTTRRAGRRGPADMDLDAIFAKAAEKGIALEVNGNPGRQDLSVEDARRALAAGAKLSLGSDGHSEGEMLAFERARRMAADAGATEKDIVNRRFVA